MTTHPYKRVNVKITPGQKEAVRRKLLEKAAEHFSRLGYDAANINEIAIDAGYAKGTIYNYFKSKEELFGEVIAEAASHAAERYDSEEASESVRESLKRLAEADVSVLREQESFMKILASEAMSPRSDNYEMILRHLGPFIEVISKILEDGVDRGEIRKDVPIAQLSLFFLGMLTLLYVQHWKSNGMWPTLEEIPDLVVTLFIDGARNKDLGWKQASKGD